MLSLIREHRRFFLGATLAALTLRIFFSVYSPTVTDDSRIYSDLATNWLQHGIYGQTQGTQVVPTDTRLPGYPAFLAAIFVLFGAGNFKAVLLAQILIDLFTCLIVADLARRTASERTAKMAFVLAALCPFTANYAAAELTETLEIFFTALALDCAVAALSCMHEAGAEKGTAKLWAATGAAIAACILLRPDGGILLAAIALYLLVAAPRENRHPNSELAEGVVWREPVAMRRFLAAGIIVAAVALAPLVPWTIRNFHTLRHFQPLAPRYANETDELVPRGFNRWVKTWIIDYTSVEEIYWNVPGDKIDAQELPARALENPNEKNATLDAIADYNQTQDMTRELDARFGQLAADRIRAHPFRYYILLPLARVADMWLRPRTEILPPDPRWWEFNDNPKYSIMAIGFGVLNLAYIAAALLAVVRRPSRIRSSALRWPGLRWPGLMLAFLLLRSAFLLTLENPEPRYTLECYPVVIVCAAAYLANAMDRRRRSESRV